jgi:hypothetical protein
MVFTVNHITHPNSIVTCCFSTFCNFSPITSSQVH